MKYTIITATILILGKQKNIGLHKKRSMLTISPNYNLITDN